MLHLKAMKKIIRYWKLKAMQEKELTMGVSCIEKNPSLGIAVWYHLAKPCYARQ